jgi:hypothetical protein
VIALAGLGSVVGFWSWPPTASSPLGVACGIAGGAIVLFEMALLPRKWLRGYRLGPAKIWMLWHIRLGILCLPVILIHTGFGFGGLVPATTLVLFLLVIASGIWGLLMQQWLPQKILTDIPNETVAGGIDFAIKSHVFEMDRLLEDVLITMPDGEKILTRKEWKSASASCSGTPGAASALIAFRERELLPYLERGRRSSSSLSSRTASDGQFANLRTLLPAAADPALRRIEELCAIRRQWDTLRRLNFWLHNWLIVHLPLSVAMTVLMCIHAARALKYW